MAEDVVGPHGGVITGLTWEEIYEGWESDEGKYYWQDFDIQTNTAGQLSTRKAHRETVRAGEGRRRENAADPGSNAETKEVLQGRDGRGSHTSAPNPR